ncbi:GyrI-like domain-containing protein [Marinilongibacter aquaticus]|uniref:GyrI-like domain-containing protein n=1 Tax=Marinilongibacter aquaticus TaxID=2975157 RepID=UPI0021BDDDAC|nr:GyrI-like domain-containing protein [Marinilongibacter aquaticus]UBM59894.1 GyrI-like domain-containing protein [Marinilongibacter aquaticus]
MNKLDLKKVFKTYYNAKFKPELVQIASAQYLSVCGKGDPSSEEFAKKVEALYASAYTLKFRFKGEQMDFVVPKLEGLWWYDENKYPSKDYRGAVEEVPRDEWEYRLLIRLPDFVKEADVLWAKSAVWERKQLNFARELEFFTQEEGLCVQIMHLGPFSDEWVSLQKIVDFMEEQGLLRNGFHHEIYLSDYRKTPMDKLKTILREPVRKKLEAHSN